MKVAALYDIHGNLPALEAVLHDIKQLKFDQIVVGGDVIVGPMSRECLDRLMEVDLPIHCIQGNCESVVLNQLTGQPLGTLPESVVEDIRWTANQLLSKHQVLISNWPETFTLVIKGLGKVLFCHATPRNDTEIFTKLTAEEKLLPLFNHLGVDVVVCGHTHMQFDRNIGETRVVNAGSVGMPFGNSGAYWLSLDKEIRLHYTSYNLEAAAQLITQTNYPSAKTFASNNILKAPSEKSMLELFTHAELS